MGNLLTRSLITAFFIFSLAMMVNISHSNAQGEQQEQAQKNVVEIVSESDEHTIFSDLLEESAFHSTLEQSGSFTVIAPTDEAIENSDLDVDQLKQDGQKLQEFMVNHLFQGEVSSSEIESAVGISISDGDLEASNGVVHTTDEVNMGG